MDKKYQVFISSTYTDLIEERQAVVQSVLDTGNIPAGMELFKGGKSQKETIKRWIEESDIYVLILGGRYGSIDAETGNSYTQWEYDLAVELNKPMFAIVLSNNYVNSILKSSESDMGKDKYVSFKQNVTTESKGGKIVGFVDNIDQMKHEVLRNIPEIKKVYADRMVGWVSANQVEEMNRLRKENKELLEKLSIRQEQVIGMQQVASVVKDEYIGEFTYNAVKQILKREKFSDSLIEGLIKATEDEYVELLEGRYNAPYEGFDDMIEEYKAIKNADRTMMDYLMLYRTDFETVSFKVPHGAIGVLFKRNFIPLLHRLELITANNIGVISFSKEGMKFITMLDMEDEQTK